MGDSYEGLPNGQGPMAGSHSAIVMAGWSKGLSVNQTVSLFSERVFRHLGYFDHWAEARSLFLRQAATLAMPLDTEFAVGAALFVGEKLLLPH